MIKSIIFDLGKVIVPFDFNRAYERMSAHSGLPITEIRSRLIKSDLFRTFETGSIEPGEFVTQVCSLLDFTIEYKEFCEIWSSIFFPETLVSAALLESLSRNYRLVLLSNTNAIHFEMIRENYPLLRHFHEFVLSFEVGAMKPSPVIYRKAVEAAGCKPEECLFFDDIGENIEGARGEGLDGVLFLGAKQLDMELRARGILDGLGS